jgi:hypothetical protein
MSLVIGHRSSVIKSLCHYVIAHCSLNKLPIISSCMVLDFCIFISYIYTFNVLKPPQMKKFILFFTRCLVFLCLPASLHSQELFTKVFYDPNANTWAYAIDRTVDTNFILCGEYNLMPSVIKLDPQGTILWSRTFGNMDGTFYSMANTVDSCVVLAGNILNSSNSDFDIFCLKMNMNGDTLWSRVIDMGYFETVHSVKQTLDHGFILAGDASEARAFVVKLDAAGNLVWGKLFTSWTSIYSGAANAIDQLPDGGYIVTGYTVNEVYGGNLMYIMKLYSNGVISWAKQVASANGYNSEGFDIVAVSGGIETYFTSQNYLSLMKTDLSGNVLWSRKFSYMADTRDNSYMKCHPTSDGGILFVSGHAYSEGLLIKTDSLGNTEWAQDLYLAITDVTDWGDGGHMVVGNGPLWGVYMTWTLNHQIGIMKTDSAGNASSCHDQWNYPSTEFPLVLADCSFNVLSAGTTQHFPIPVSIPVLQTDTGCVAMTGGVRETAPVNAALEVYPNPSDGSFHLTTTGITPQEITALEVYNIFGKRIFFSTDPAVIRTELNLGNVPDGLYTVKVTIEKSDLLRKLLICK